MKKLILAATLSVSSICANASNHASDREEYCKSIYDLSEIIMKARQNGVSMKRSIEIVSTTYNNDKLSIELAKSVVEWAYSKPMYQTDVFKRNAINEFAEKAYYSCKDVMLGKKK